jgi:hypothetical protein
MQGNLYQLLSLLGVESADSAHSMLARSLHGPTLLPVLDAPLYATQGDTVSLATLVLRTDSALRSAREPSSRRFAEYGTLSARAYLALARHDTATALAAFLAMPDTLRPAGLDMLTMVRLLSARHRDRAALLVLERPPLFGFYNADDVLYALERGRVAERLGEREIAAAAFRFVADMWVHADPELMPYVAEAHRALTRLSPDRRPEVRLQ